MKSLSIVIPVYNEAARLSGCFSALFLWKPPKDVLVERIIFVDDGSSDNSISKIKYQKPNIENNLKATVHIITYKQNQGKGYAVARGMAASESDYTLFMDADVATPLSQISRLVPCMLKGVDVIVGTRKNGISTVVRHQPIHREFFGRGFTYLTNILLNTWVSDFTCGFKAFSRYAKDAIFPALSVKRWAFDAETLFLARKLGFTIREVPVTWSDQDGSKVNLIRDIPITLSDLTRIRLRDFKIMSPLFSAVRSAISVFL